MPKFQVIYKLSKHYKLNEIEADTEDDALIEAMNSLENLEDAELAFYFNDEDDDYEVYEIDKEDL